MKAEGGPGRQPLRCPVRGCGEGLALTARAATCPRGHHFDRARSGYWNLLQPQDRKSLDAGDSKEVVAARRRLFDIGFFAPLTSALESLTAGSFPASPSPGGGFGDGGERGTEGVRVLDVGCGEGSHLAAFCAHLGTHWSLGAGIGIDLSTPAIELAARSHPHLTWIVANADRGLPLEDASVDIALSITARRPIAELARVLKPGGLLLFAIPAPDDLAELRSAVLGDDDHRDRFPTVLAELGQAPGAFELLEQTTVRHRCQLDRQGLADLVATTYRGGRKAREERLAALDAGGMGVTGAWVVGMNERT